MRDPIVTECLVAGRGAAMARGLEGPDFEDAAQEGAIAAWLKIKNLDPVMGQNGYQRRAYFKGAARSRVFVYLKARARAHRIKVKVGQVACGPVVALPPEGVSEVEAARILQGVFDDVYPELLECQRNLLDAALGEVPLDPAWLDKGTSLASYHRRTVARKISERACLRGLSVDVDHVAGALWSRARHGEYTRQIAVAA